MSDPTSNLYSQTYDQILSSVLGGSKKNFQLVNPMEDWTWPPSSYGYIDPQAYRFVGQVPLWSAVGEYKPGGSDMHQSYLQVLSLWNALGKGINDDHVREAQDQVTGARKKYVEDQQIADVSYSSYAKQVPAGETPQSYDSWIADNWKTTFDADNLEYKKALDALALVVGQKNAGLQFAIEAATPPQDVSEYKSGFTKTHVGSVMEVRPNYIFPDPSEWANRIGAEGGNSLKIHVSASESSSSLEKSWAGGSTGIEKGFFSLFGSDSWQKIDLETEDKTVTVDITIKAYSLFEVGPDPSWYHSGLLSVLAIEDDWNPPYCTNSSGGKTPVFGKGGVLPLVLTGIVAGYQPCIDITMSDATYSRYKEHFDASAGIRVGPFQIGGSGANTQETIRKNSDNKKFHVESNATYPFIMGITVANPGE